MFFFGFGGEQRVTRKQFCSNAPEAPHVNPAAIRHTEDDFRCSVKAALNVGVDFLTFEATGSKVDESYTGLSRLLQDYVFGLQVAVHDVMLHSRKKYCFEEHQRLQNLHSQLSDEVECETLKLVFLHEVVEAHVEQLEDNALPLGQNYHVPTKDNEVSHPHHVGASPHIPVSNVP